MPLHDDLADLLRKIERVKPEGVPSEPNEAFTQEKAYLEHQKALVKLEGERQDIRERKKYALYFFVLACSWVLIIAALLFFEGFGPRLRFNLSDRVLLAAIGSTTANILGILFVVANYLFRRS